MKERKTCGLDAHRVFTPNLICWSAEDEDEIHHTESTTDFLEALEDLTHVADDERERKVITFFHNLRSRTRRGETADPRCQNPIL